MSVTVWVVTAVESWTWRPWMRRYPGGLMARWLCFGVDIER